MKKIAVLGSTGSIGTQTLEIVRTNQDIKVTALAAGTFRTADPGVLSEGCCGVERGAGKGTERKDPGSGCESTLWNGRIACGGSRT